jgi:NAD(P) transhydrogenase subunit beta
LASRGISGGTPSFCNTRRQKRGVSVKCAVHPAARTDTASAICGMPILNADHAKQVFVIKRGEGKDYAGIVNELFYAGNCNMVYGDARAVLIKMGEAVRGLGLPAVA